jgi:hypothetical protein
LKGEQDVGYLHALVRLEYWDDCLFPAKSSIEIRSGDGGWSKVESEYTKSSDRQSKKMDRAQHPAQRSPQQHAQGTLAAGQVDASISLSAVIPDEGKITPRATFTDNYSKCTCSSNGA